MSNNKLDNKIILVTGANTGIGRAAAIAYAMQGARLILLGRNMNSLEEVYDEIESRNCHEPMISIMDFETADQNDYQMICENMMDEFGENSNFDQQI